MLREADISLMFFNPPDAVQNFLNHCKYLVEQMKIMIYQLFYNVRQFLFPINTNTD